MKIKVTLLALAISASVGCGRNEKKSDQEESSQPQKVTSEEELARLEAVSANMPHRVLTRVKVVNGKPDTNNIEMIKVSETAATTQDPKELDALFAKAGPDDRIGQIQVSDDTDVSSDQCFFCARWYWPVAGFYWRWWRRPIVNVNVFGGGYNIGYGAGFNNIYMPYRPLYNACGLGVAYASPCGGYNGYGPNNYWSYSMQQAGAPIVNQAPGVVGPGPGGPGPGIDQPVTPAPGDQDGYGQQWMQ